jgi:uncharacterized membrane protein
MTAKQAEHVREAAPGEMVRESVEHLVDALAQRALSSATGKIGAVTGRLTDLAERDGPGLAAVAAGAKGLAKGRSPAAAALRAGLSGAREKIKGAAESVVKGTLAGGRAGGKGGSLKVTNIVESADVGVPVDLAYDQWTRFTDFPSFMKKVERVEQVSDEKLGWKAQVFWSHRTWESTIIEQVRNVRIVWNSKGQKGYVDGAVSFHGLGPELTRIILVLEYHPQGFFEHTGNLWRAQGRRARLEFKHFQRHVMTRGVLHPDEIEGWHGEIHDGKVQEQVETQAFEDEAESRVGTPGLPDRSDADDDYDGEGHDESDRRRDRGSRRPDESDGRRGGLSRTDTGDHRRPERERPAAERRGGR